jgi:nucleoside-diphosphate-sugar epimerase
MRVLVSGATGLVGRFVVEHLLARGHEVMAGVREMPAALPFSRHVDVRCLTLDPADEQTAGFDGIDGFVHAAFQHVPGRYRGGEGDDPQGFRRANIEGTVALFHAAREAGVRRCVFLSSRAVYGRRAGLLTEDMEPEPESLYGQVKTEAERVLAQSNTDSFVTASLRSTGIYGLLPDMPHKWEALARDYLAGKPVTDRVGTEVHGEDLAAAVDLILTEDASLIGGRGFNVSDLLTSHRDVLSEFQQATTCVHPPLPAPADRSAFSEMETSRLRALGWRPGGLDRFRADIAALAERITAA